MSDQPSRYSRQVVLPEIGEDGQGKIRSSTVLIVGLGGLGNPAAMYLAGAGIGTLILNDFDTVDETNLHRQPLFSLSDVGENKISAAALRLGACNDEVDIQLLDQRLDSAELRSVVNQCDVVLDGSDNFATRFAVNTACVATATPLVSGASIRFEGHLSVFDTRQAESPCYRCLYSEEAETLEDCAGQGILGPVAGVVGSLMGVEALKLIAGCGEAAIGRLLIYDALSANWREVRIRRDTDCPVCSSRP